jgi:hypothetical protein
MNERGARPQSADADAFVEEPCGAVEVGADDSEGDTIMKLSADVVRMPVSIKTALPEAARSLEQAWQRRRQELGGWQPSGGWLVDPRVLARKTAMSQR